MGVVVNSHADVACVVTVRPTHRKTRKPVEVHALLESPYVEGQRVINRVVLPPPRHPSTFQTNPNH